MSLLPARFQNQDDMPMSLGKAIAKAIAPKVDPIAAFETGKHLPAGKSRSQLLREAGFTRRPSVKSILREDDEPAPPYTMTAAELMADLVGAGNGFLVRPATDPAATPVALGDGWQEKQGDSRPADFLAASKIQVKWKSYGEGLPRPPRDYTEDDWKNGACGDTIIAYRVLA